MRRFAALLSLCLSVLLFATAPGSAQAAGPICSSRVFIPLEGLPGVAGFYTLSNGDTLKVSREGRRYYANMDGTGRVEILALDEDDFAERGGPLRFNFSNDPADVDVRIDGIGAPRPNGQACPEREGLGCLGLSCVR